MPGAGLLVARAVHASAVGGLALRTGRRTRLIQHITRGQLGEAHLTKLLRCRPQFEFDGERGLHIPVCFFSTLQPESRAGLPPTPEARGYPHHQSHETIYTSLYGKTGQTLA